uniref:Uncharacterized protein n=1 Tax=Vespula pensylvanica TaxID=30213 RepID=A0A834P4T2_VESPE|nr:hypothetical protein H0235_005477 [Vespula pensylvanica]
MGRWEMEDGLGLLGKEGKQSPDFMFDRATAADVRANTTDIHDQVRLLAYIVLPHCFVVPSTHGRDDGGTNITPVKVTSSG